MNNLISNVAREIRKERHNRNLSQEVLSGLAGINRSYLSSIETGKKSLSLEVFVKISKALEIEPHIFLKKILS